MTPRLFRTTAAVLCQAQFTGVTISQAPHPLPLNKTQHRPEDSAGDIQYLVIICQTQGPVPPRAGGAVAGGAIAEKDPLPVGVLTKATCRDSPRF